MSRFLVKFKRHDGSFFFRGMWEAEVEHILYSREYIGYDIKILGEIMDEEGGRRIHVG